MRLGPSRTRAVRAIKALYIENTLCRNALLGVRNNLESVPARQLRFAIPYRQRRDRVLIRRKPVIMRGLRDLLDHGLYEQSLVFLVAVVDAYVADVLVTMLRLYPEKMGAERKQVALRHLLVAHSIESVLGSVIREHVSKILRDTPTSYLTAVEEILSIELPSELKKEYVEVTATRDLVVHADGRIDKTYLLKTGISARGEEGGRITVDEKYFKSACGLSLALIDAMHHRTTVKHRRRPTTA